MDTVSRSSSIWKTPEDRESNPNFRSDFLPPSQDNLLFVFITMLLHLCVVMAIFGLGCLGSLICLIDNQTREGNSFAALRVLAEHDFIMGFTTNIPVIIVLPSAVLAMLMYTGWISCGITAVVTGTIFVWLVLRYYIFDIVLHWFKVEEITVQFENALNENIPLVEAEKILTESYYKKEYRGKSFHDLQFTNP